MKGKIHDEVKKIPHCLPPIFAPSNYHGKIHHREGWFLLTSRLSWLLSLWQRSNQRGRRWVSGKECLSFFHPSLHERTSTILFERLSRELFTEHCERRKGGREENDELNTATTSMSTSERMYTSSTFNCLVYTSVVIKLFILYRTFFRLTLFVSGEQRRRNVFYSSSLRHLKNDSGKAEKGLVPSTWS